MTQTLEESIQQIFIQHQWTLSLAESCTGGALSALLTQLPGCSQYFLGSIVSYSNDLKINLLGVDPEVLREKGAVSEQVVLQMVEGVMRLTGSDYAIAVSGIAGPTGGSLAKPIGMIWGAIGQKGKVSYTWSFQLTGNRRQIIQESSKILLNQLYLLLKTEEQDMDIIKKFN